MQLIFKDPVVTKNDVKSILSQKKIKLPTYRLAVIVVLEDEQGRIILQRRGPKSRDEFNHLEDIGGAVEKTDTTLISALYREVKEEVGNKASITLAEFIGAVLETKYDPRTNQDVNWLFCLYHGIYHGGQLLINEPGKCLGYEFYYFEDLPLAELSATSVFFNQLFHESKQSVDQQTRLHKS